MASYAAVVQLVLSFVATLSLYHGAYPNRNILVGAVNSTSTCNEHEDCAPSEINEEANCVLCEDPEIDIDETAVLQVMGEWHVIWGYSTANTIPAFCRPLTLASNSTHVDLCWTLTEADLDAATMKSPPIPSGALQIAGPSLWRETPGLMEVKLLRHVIDHLILTLSRRDGGEMKALLLCRDRHPVLETQNTTLIRTALQQTGVVTYTHSSYMCFAAYQ